MNMRDDYSRISQFALEEKKAKTLDKWMKAIIPTYYIMVDNISRSGMSSLAEVQYNR